MQTRHQEHFAKTDMARDVPWQVGTACTHSAPNLPQNSGTACLSDCRDAERRFRRTCRSGRNWSFFQAKCRGNSTTKQETAYTHRESLRFRPWNSDFCAR